MMPNTYTRGANGLGQELNHHAARSSQPAIHTLPAELTTGQSFQWRPFSLPRAIARVEFGTPLSLEYW